MSLIVQHIAVNKNAACLGIGTVILCRHQKNVDGEKSGLSHVLKRWSACAQQLIKYSFSEGDQVFLLLLELSPFFGLEGTPKYVFVTL